MRNLISHGDHEATGKLGQRRGTDSEFGHLRIYKAVVSLFLPRHRVLELQDCEIEFN